MITTAVTSSDSALTTELDQQVPTDDASVAAYMESANRRDVARMRGEKPSTEDSATSQQKTEPQEKETESEAPAENEDSATSSETAAASEAATTQEQRDTEQLEKKGKTSATSESRWAKVTRENRELRDRLARLETASATRDTQQASQPAAEQRQQQTQAPAKPKFDDVDDKGQAKYKTYDEYLDAHNTWLREDIKRELSEGQAKTQREQQQRQMQETIGREWGSRIQKAQEKYADYDAVALNPDLPLKQGSAADAFILDSPHGTDVLYHLGKNPKELERIQGKPVYDAKGLLTGFTGGLNPVAQVREFTKIELKFSSPPARRITQAPPPARTVNAQGTTGSDEVEQALKEDDTAGYMAAANARDLARRKGK